MGKSLGSDKRQNGDTHTFTRVSAGELTLSIYSTQRWNVGNKITMRSSAILSSRA